MYKLMIVDDEPFVRTGFRMSLDWRRHGFEVSEEASNGGEALEKIRQCQPEVVFTDIKMPVMDGIRLIRAVKAEFPRIILVVMSNYDEFDLVKEAMKAGAEDYFLKVTVDIGKLGAFLDELREKIEKSEANFQATDAWTGAVTFFAKEASPVHISNVTKMLEDDRTHPPLSGAFFLITVPGFGVYAEEKQGNNLSKATKLLSAAVCSAEACSQNALILFSQNKWVLLMNGTEFTPEDAMRSAAEGIVLAVQQYLGLECDIGYGVTYGSEAGLKELLAGGDRCFDPAFYGKDAYHVDPRERLQSLPPDSLRGLEDMDERLGQFRLGELPGRMEQLLAAAEAARVAPGPYKEYAIRMLMLLELKLTSYASPGLRASPEEYISPIYCACSAREVRQTVLTVAEGILKQLREAAAGCRSEVAQALEYIRMHYGEKITLQDTADCVHISKSYLSALFKAEYNLSFQDYLIKFRMEKAAQLLLVTSMRVSEICEKVGYGDLFYFDRSFKKFFGKSPKEFRRSVREPMDGRTANF